MLSKEQILVSKSRPIWKSFHIMRSKQEVMKVVFLCGNLFTLICSVSKGKSKGFPSLIAVGAVGVSPTVSWVQLMKGKAHPPPFTALSFPNLKKVPIHCLVDSESFQVIGRQSPASNSQPSSNFLHHNQAALTTIFRHLSK